MLRNLLEFVVIGLIAVGLLVLQGVWGHSPALHKVLLLVACWGKTAFFVAEEMVQLRDATRRNLPYHLFMRLMLVNMFQIILSFGLDYYCLLHLNRSAFSVDEGLTGSDGDGAAVDDLHGEPRGQCGQGRECCQADPVDSAAPEQHPVHCGAAQWRSDSQASPSPLLSR